ncbi:MAG: phage tail assembly protein [Proteobacteria bacterium]|nr:phage tail assembly protein [Pseudomonadota bacterium]
MKITLCFPFTTAAGVRIESLELPRPKRSDLKAAQKFSDDAIDQEDFLFCRLTGLVVEDLDQLEVADNKALSDAFQAMAVAEKTLQSLDDILLLVLRLQLSEIDALEMDDCFFWVGAMAELGLTTSHMMISVNDISEMREVFNGLLFGQHEMLRKMMENAVNSFVARRFI